MKHKAAAKTGKRNSVRVIGGALRSRRIEFVDSEGLRPTSDRIRETLFNWIQNEVPGARCLDLFAGSGVLGIEAVSRGASWVDLVEMDRKVAQELANTIHSLGLSNARLEISNAALWLERARSAADKLYDIVFLDPPFADELLPATCALLNDRAILSEGALVYLESDQALSADTVPENWLQLKAKKAGQVNFYLYKASWQD